MKTMIGTDRILILDGGMGTMLQRHGLAGNSELFNVTDPGIIESIHREYVSAGADIIETNTFSANRISQKDHGMENRAYELAKAGASIARKVADGAGRKVYVAGSVGPTSKSLTLSPDVDDPSRRTHTFEEMVAAYTEQLNGLIDGGVDLIEMETFFDALNAKAAIYALEKINDIRGGIFPLIISATASDKSGRTLTGQTIEAFYNSVRHYPLTAFGMNCSLGAEDMIPLIKEVAEFSEFPVICYPNAGLPNEMGGYDETPEHMASEIRKMAEQGAVNIVGGCCGTTPDHIAAIAKAVEGIAPHNVRKRENILKVSGLEAVDVDVRKNNFTNIGERTNVAGSRKFAKLIAAGEYDTALQVAADQIENGASIIDINMDDAMLDSGKEMQTFVRYIQNDPAVAKAALMIDSSHWDTILAGLRNAQGKCIVNSISLKEGEEKFLDKAREIRYLGAAMVVMAFDENGQATSYDRKIEICQRAYRLLTEKAGVQPEDIIFDVNVLSVGTGLAEHARYGIDFIEAVRWIKKNLPGALTSGGISNLSFSFRGNNTVREAMHSVFLYHAIRAGLDMGIVNPGMLQIYDEIEPELLKCAEDVILDTDDGATERLIAKAQEIMAAKDADMTADALSKAVEPTVDTPEERVSAALVKGKAVNLEEDVMACFNRAGSAVKVIEGPLMAGMEKVGELFGAGKMFLPQVVKSAKIMRDAVSILEPYMTTGDDASYVGASRPVAVYATVKGDVHDIGKNITGIVLSCNGFEVVDLGVMVDKETILDEALRRGAAIIGVSGLITPSLHQMEEICREMTAREMDIPLFIGGATTSALHTAVKLAPLYKHVFYSPDASTNAVMAKKCLMDRAAFEADEHAAQDKIRALYESRQKPLSEMFERPMFAAESFLGRGEYSFTDTPTRSLTVREIEPFFDWNMFLTVWGIKSKDNPESAELLEEGRAMLSRMDLQNALAIKYAVRFFDAYADGDSIVLEEGLRLPMFRQEKPEAGKSKVMSLCDFVPDKSLGIRAPFGIFAVSVSKIGAHPAGCNCEACQNEYGSMMERSLRVTLAEAVSSWLDAWIKSRISRSDVKVCKPAAGYSSCPDHTLKGDILRLLPDGDKLGIRLTDSYAMIPDASICGFIVTHPSASYPEIRSVSKEQVDRYARERGMNEEEKSKFLGSLL